MRGFLSSRHDHPGGTATDRAWIGYRVTTLAQAWR
jgi:hypothetical protein